MIKHMKLVLALVAIALAAGMLVGTLVPQKPMAQSGLMPPNTVQAGPPSGVSSGFGAPRSLVGADFNAGIIPNSALANQSTTVNGVLCTLGLTCTVTATIGGVTIGTTTIGAGTTLRVLYDNGGVLGEYTNAQLTAIINQATASLPGLMPAWPNNTTTFLRGDDTFATLNFGALGGSAGCAQLPALTGDLTSSGCAATFATVNTNVGSFGSATFIPNFIVNAKGLITAAGQSALTYSAANLTGATLNAGVVTSSLTAVGALGGGSVTTGFTINAANVTWSGLIPAAQLPLATTSTFGAVEPDNSTILITAGVIRAPGSGGGTVSNCPINNIGYFAAAGTTLGCLATANSAILVTSAGGVPSLGTALPTSFGINASNITWSGTIPGSVMTAANLAASGNGGVTGLLPAANLSLAPIANSLGSDVLLNNTATYFTGPTFAQGPSGTWVVFGSVALGSPTADNYLCNLWDGTTPFASGSTTNIAGTQVVMSLSAIVATPAANLRISCKDVSTTSGKIFSNISGGTKDSTLSAFRIN